MEPKLTDVEDQRRFEIALMWASLLAQPEYRLSLYSRTIPFCSITKTIVLQITYFRLSLGNYSIFLIGEICN